MRAHALWDTVTDLVLENLLAHDRNSQGAAAKKRLVLKHSTKERGYVCSGKVCGNGPASSLGVRWWRRLWFMGMDDQTVADRPVTPGRAERGVAVQ